MLRRSTLALTVMTAASVLLAGPALAGGWAVSSLDEPPPDFRAGGTHQIGFTVRQHGKTPWTGGEAGIEAQSAKTGERLFFQGVPEGAPGHYVAEVTLPTAGAWQWAVVQGPLGPQPMGEIEVLPAAQAQPTAPAPAAVPAVLPYLLLGVTVVALAMFGLEAASFLRQRRAPAAEPVTRSG